jgi:hypothetical protein
MGLNRHDRYQWLCVETTPVEPDGELVEMAQPQNLHELNQNFILAAVQSHQKFTFYSGNCTTNF